MVSKKKYKSLIDDICQDCCESNKWCILKEFLSETGTFNTRLLMQIKCIEKFKFEESARQSKELDWNESSQLWAENGFAKSFNEFYDEDIKFLELYKKIISS